MASKSHKTVAELEAAMIELYGTVHGNGRRFAADIGKTNVSVSRYLSGSAPVGKTTALLIDELLKKHRAAPAKKGAKGEKAAPATMELY